MDTGRLVGGLGDTLMPLSLAVTGVTVGVAVGVASTVVVGCDVASCAAFR